MKRFILMAVCAATPALSDDIDCDNAMTQQAMNHCAHQAYALADEELNLAYKLAMSQAKAQDEYIENGDTPAATMLRDAQRAWIDFRDKACALESTIARGGSLQPLLYSSCLERETRQRTEALRYFGEVN